MGKPNQLLGEILINQRLITRGQLEATLRRQQERRVPTGQLLVELGFVTEQKLLCGWAAHLGVSPWDFSKDKPEPGIESVLPPEVCREYLMVPVMRRNDLLYVAMKNPLDVEAIELARNLSGLRIEPMLALSAQITEAVEKVGVLSCDQAHLNTLVDQAIKESGRGKNRSENAHLTEEDTRPVISIVNQILSNAIRTQASDVHIEPGEKNLVVRYRVDGQLTKILNFPIEVLPMVATRLKILAELDVVEYRIPQDGRITAEIDGRNVDLRVSFYPNEYGTRIVLRILEKKLGLRNLSDLGFDETKLEVFRKMIHRPHGLVLVTGPTGSGKTTTLYGALQEVLSENLNIVTCEDPVEYSLEGVSQSSVNEKIGLTFASLLRSALRQDPDVILVGEIRDYETAETAIRAALTGHLVLSTLHCNDALSAIPRLIDMGVDPYLLSTCLVGVTGQRLVRKLCSCQTADGKPKTNCSTCRNTGYKGRIAVHETMFVDSALAEAISARQSMSELAGLAAKSGYEPMIGDAMRKIEAGITTLEEARRVLVLDDVDVLLNKSVKKAA